MGWEGVIRGDHRYSIQQADAPVMLRSMPDKSVGLTLFSPPYTKQRTYGIGFKLTGQKWVDWLRPIIVEACRVTDGLVIVNAAGPVVGYRYQPVMEWLVADLTRHDGIVCGPSPWCWWKVCGIPGSGHKRYQRRDWEPLYGFCLPDRLPLKWTDNTWGGGPPKWNPGGEMSNRLPDGRKRNERNAEMAARNDDPWKTASRGGSGCGGRRKNGNKMTGPQTIKHTKRVASTGGDVMSEQVYTPPKIANPGNVIQAEEPEPWTPADGGQVIEARVGGNALGNKLAHDNEAPMAMKVAERLICQYCPPRGIVMDFMCGSGTTLEAALKHNRRAVGADLRQSQVDLAHRRVMGTTLSFLDLLDDDQPTNP